MMTQAELDQSPASGRISHLLKITAQKTPNLNVFTRTIPREGFQRGGGRGGFMYTSKSNVSLKKNTKVEFRVPSQLRLVTCIHLF